jgi:hypothetical protein
MRNIISAALILVICLTQGCAVIHFENGEVQPDPRPGLAAIFSEAPSELDASTGERYRRTYHHSLYQLAELSNPLDLSQVCIGLDWNQVTTEVTPIDVVLGFLDNALFYHASAAGVDLWSPWSMEYSCRTPR